VCAGAQNFDIGKYEYDGHCAICHGTSGKGDGPFEGLLKSGTVVPDLTELSKKNNGVFPFAHVYATIDGTVLTKAPGHEGHAYLGPSVRDQELLLES